MNNVERLSVKAAGLVVVLCGMAMPGHALDVVVEEPISKIAGFSLPVEPIAAPLGENSPLLLTAPAASAQLTPLTFGGPSATAMSLTASPAARVSPVRSARPAATHPGTSLRALNSGAARVGQDMKTGNVPAISSDLGRLMDGEDPPGNPDPFLNPGENNPAPEPGTPQPTVPLPDEGKSALKAMPAGAGIGNSGGSGGGAPRASASEFSFPDPKDHFAAALAAAGAPDAKLVSVVADFNNKSQVLKYVFVSFQSNMFIDVQTDFTGRASRKDSQPTRDLMIFPIDINTVVPLAEAVQAADREGFIPRYVSLQRGFHGEVVYAFIAQDGESRIYVDAATGKVVPAMDGGSGDAGAEPIVRKLIKPVEPAQPVKAGGPLDPDAIRKENEGIKDAFVGKYLDPHGTPGVAQFNLDKKNRVDPAVLPEILAGRYFKEALRRDSNAKAYRLDVPGPRAYQATVVYVVTLQFMDEAGEMGLFLADGRWIATFQYDAQEPAAGDGWTVYPVSLKRPNGAEGKSLSQLKSHEPGSAKSESEKAMPSPYEALFGLWRKTWGKGSDRLEVSGSKDGMRVSDTQGWVWNLSGINGPAVIHEPWRGTWLAPGGLVTGETTLRFESGKLEERVVTIHTPLLRQPTQFVQRWSLEVRDGRLIQESEATLYQKRYLYWGPFDTVASVNTTNLVHPDHPKETTVYERVTAPLRTK